MMASNRKHGMVTETDSLDLTSSSSLNPQASVDGVKHDSGAQGLSIVNNYADTLISHATGIDLECLKKIPDVDIPKMMFLAIDPNEAAKIDLHIPGKINYSGEILQPEKNPISRLHTKFKEALTEKTLNPVRREMQVRLFTLSSHQINAQTDSITPIEEDFLEFNEIYEMFGHTVPEFLKINFGKVIALHKIKVGDPVSDKKNCFVYTENKIMLDICNCLTASDVLQMYDGLRQSKDVEIGEWLRDIFELKLEEDTIHNIPGLKEAAFFYLVLGMMRKNMLNRLYTHKLAFLLNKVMEYNKDHSKKYDYIKPLCDNLEKYPMTSRPPGICIIFSMHDKLPGAEHDLKSVKALFEDVFMYDVFHKIDPSQDDIDSFITDLDCPRNKFYDSLVVFFMGHGSKSHLVLKNGVEIHRRSEFIGPFTKLKWFLKKPKAIFIEACAIKDGRKRTKSFNEGKGLRVETDSSGWNAAAGEKWQSKYGDHTDLSLVNSFADTLVSYATMWYEKAARGKEGTLYVETLVDQLREYGQHESIENVLKRVHYNVNTVSLLTDHEGEEVEWKQTPLLESTLQKHFIFPSNGTVLP